MEKIQAFVSEQLKTEVPQFGIGDGVKVYIRITEGEKERIQLFEGTVTTASRARTTNIHFLPCFFMKKLLFV